MKYLLLLAFTLATGAIADNIWVPGELISNGHQYNTHRYEVTYDCEGTAKARFADVDYPPGTPFRVTGKQYPEKNDDPERVVHYFGFEISSAKGGVRNWEIYPDGEWLRVRRYAFHNWTYPMLFLKPGTIRFTTHEGDYLQCRITLRARLFDWEAGSAHADLQHRRRLDVPPRSRINPIDCRCDIPNRSCHRFSAVTSQWDDLTPWQVLDGNGLSSATPRYYTRTQWQVYPTPNHRMRITQGAPGDLYTASIVAAPGEFFFLTNYTEGYSNGFLRYVHCYF